MFENIRNRDFSKELIFSASRSSGPGGQNVNKVSSKIELRFNVLESTQLSIEEKEIIQDKLGNKINKQGELVLVSQSERSQISNKEKVIERFYALISKALTIQKKRRPTKTPFKAKALRLENKRLKSEKKELRKDIEFK